MPQDVSLTLSPLLPAWAIASVAIALCLLLVQGSLLLRRKKIPPRWVGTLAVLRTLIIVVLILCLLQPMFSYTRRTERKPDLLVMVDTSQSMAKPAAGADSATRLDAAVETLQRGEMLDSLYEQFDVHWFAFDRNAYPLEEGDLSRLKAEGDSTRFAESLSAAIAHQRQGASDGNGPPMRVMLVSDGDDLGAQDVVETARRLGVPVDTLAPEGADVSPAPASTVVIASMQSPGRVMLGSETQIVATLRAEGPSPGPQQLSLVEEGEALASEPVTFRAGETEQIIRLSHRPQEVGLRKYELRLSAPGAPAPHEFTVSVVEDKKQVLVLEDNWRWAFKFLRRVIEDDPSFSFTAFVSRSGGGGIHAQFAEADRKTTLAGFPQSGADLSWFDTIVLGDVSPRRWPSALAAGIAQAVKDDGKSLVIIAGPNLANLAESPELNALLPAEVTRESAQPIEGPVEVRPSTEGADSEFFFNIPGGALPPLDRVYPPLRKRPAATILLEAATRANAYGKLIVLAEHTVGRGRVLFIGTDSLWNWQMVGPLDEQGVTPYAAFWQQALRALAPPHARSGDVTLAFEPDRSRYEAGARVVLRARYRSTSPLNAPEIQANVTLPDQRRVPLTFEADPSQPNTFSTQLDAMLPGQYRITGGIGSRGQPAAADAQAAFDVQPAPGEASSVRVDHANLARIAAATRGKTIRPSDPSTWPTTGDRAVYAVQEAKRLDLWGSLTLLVILSFLLGTDWLLRLVRGYV